MDKTTILLVRHGQTEWNLQKRFQGRLDSPLTPRGVMQAQWLGEALRDVPIDYIYSSASTRASDTAKLIRAERNIPLATSEQWMEMHLGEWEGLEQTHVQKTAPGQYDNFWNAPDRFEVFGGETFRQVERRALGELERIVATHTGNTVLIVTHTVVVKLVMAYYEKRPLADIWLPPYIHPVCLCKIEIADGTPTIVLHGDISHYKEEAEEH